MRFWRIGGHFQDFAKRLLSDSSHILDSVYVPGGFHYILSKMNSIRHKIRAVLQHRCTKRGNDITGRTAHESSSLFNQGCIRFRHRWCLGGWSENGRLESKPVKSVAERSQCNHNAREFSEAHVNNVPTTSVVCNILWYYDSLLHNRRDTTETPDSQWSESRLLNWIEWIDRVCHFRWYFCRDNVICGHL